MGCREFFVGYNLDEIIDRFRRYYLYLAIQDKVVATCKASSSFGLTAKEYFNSIASIGDLPDHVNCRCGMIVEVGIMDLRKDVETELERNKKLLTARMNKPSGLQKTAVIKSRIIFSEDALENGSEEVLMTALSKLRRTGDEGE